MKQATTNPNHKKKMLTMKIKELTHQAENLGDKWFQLEKIDQQLTSKIENLKKRCFSPEEIEQKTQVQQLENCIESELHKRIHFRQNRKEIFTRIETQQKYLNELERKKQELEERLNLLEQQKAVLQGDFSEQKKETSPSQDYKTSIASKTMTRSSLSRFITGLKNVFLSNSK